MKLVYMAPVEPGQILGHDSTGSEIYSAKDSPNWTLELEPENATETLLLAQLVESERVRPGSDDMLQTVIDIALKKLPMDRRLELLQQTCAEAMN